MDITVGADVVGTDGKLGEVQGMIVDARTEQATDLVVKHGLIFTSARVVPLPHVIQVEDGAVYVDLDSKGFEAMDGFAEELTGPSPDYVGAPDYDLQGTRQGNFVYRATVASFGQWEGKPLGYPGGEQLSPDLHQRPAIKTGMDVLDVTGERVGEVGAFSIDPETRAPAQLSVRQGTLFKQETELPLAWVKSLSDEGVLLNVHKDEVEALADRS